ncbi:PQQ-binding-like beta-propeller repeat protein [bacterium]|nr:PQQ-binding-like beta-propeller repeat protein [bacterium]
MSITSLMKPAGRSVAVAAAIATLVMGVAAMATGAMGGAARAEAASPVLLLPARPTPGFTIEVLWERVVSLPGQALLTGAVADLDGDGRDEVLLHGGRRNDPSQVTVLDGADGHELWRAAFPGRSCVVTADIDGDGSAEVVVACGADLSVLDGATGELVLGTTLRGTIGDLVCARVCARPGIIYTAGKKRDDVMVALSGENLHELWTRDAAPGRGPFARGFTHPSAWDVDGDGGDEVLVAENGNHLLCLSGGGELLWDVGLGECERLNPGGVVSSTPVVADFFGDGIAELAVGCFAGAVVVMDARTGDVLDRFQFGVESHGTHLTNEKIPRFIRNALSTTGEPVNCLTVVELDGGPGSELVLGCSDGFLYACDPGSGDVMWRFDTLETVYDPCVLVRPTDVSSTDDHSIDDQPRDSGDGLTDEADALATCDLLAWDVEGVYLLDGRTGLARAGFDGVPGAARVLPCDLDGAGALEIIHVASETRRVTAWRCVVGAADGDANGASGPAGDAPANGAP